MSFTFFLDESTKMYLFLFTNHCLISCRFYEYWFNIDFFCIVINLIKINYEMKNLNVRIVNDCDVLYFTPFDKRCITCGNEWVTN